MRLIDHHSPQYPKIPLQTKPLALLYLVRATPKPVPEAASYF